MNSPHFRTCGLNLSGKVRPTPQSLPSIQPGADPLTVSPQRPQPSKIVMRAGANLACSSTNPTLRSFLDNPGDLSWTTHQCSMAGIQVFHVPGNAALRNKRVLQSRGESIILESANVYPTTIVALFCPRWSSGSGLEGIGCMRSY